MASPTLSKLVESFKNTHIPPIDGKPTYATLHGIHELLNSNAVSIANNLGCRTLVHVCFTLYPTIYTTLSTTRVAPLPHYWRNARRPGWRDWPQSSVHPVRPQRNDSRLSTVRSANNFLGLSATRSCKCSTSRTAGTADPAR